MSTAQPAVEGADGTVVAYRERLHAPWWVWLLGTVLTGSLGVAYGFRLGAVPGVVTFLVAQALLAALLLVTAPVVVVDDAVLRAAGVETAAATRRRGAAAGCLRLGTG